MQLQKVTNYDPYAYLKAKETEHIKVVKPEKYTQYFEEMPTKSFRDILNVSSNASSDSNSYGNDIPVAVFTGFHRFESTGDPESDKNIEYALDYYSSCFDFTNKWDYDKLTAEEDFTGMSRAEKYKAIYEKYQHCYGENFLEADAVDYPLIPSDYDPYSRVIRKFEKEVKAACGSDRKVQEARRDALYGNDLSDTEVRQAIIEKYVHDGKITNRDYCKMTKEMDLCGVGGGIHNSNDGFKIPNNIFEYLREKNHTAAAEQKMDCYITKSDINDFVEIYEHRRYVLHNVLPEYGTALNQIAEALGYNI